MKFLIPALIRYADKLLTRWSDYFVASTLHPKIPVPFSRFSTITECAGDVAIIMQGPIITQHNFTYESLRAYRNKYPLAYIILSTWKGQSEGLVEQIRNLPVDVLELEPVAPGVSNINLQIHSTASAVRKLPDSCDYVLKTRTDQRFDVGRDFLGYFKNLQSMFPVKSDVVCDRLIITSQNNSYDRLYPVADFMMFGRREDISLYWDIPFDEKSIRECGDLSDSRNFMKLELAEGYLLKHFFSNVGYMPIWTDDCSNRFLSRYFCVVDPLAIGQFWFKYQWYLNSHRKRSKQLIPFDAIGFVEWLSLYCRYKDD